MHLNRIDDPRDALQRARLTDIVRFAEAKNIAGITCNSFAIVAKREIRDRGLAREFAAWARGNVQFKPLGQPSGPSVTSDQATAVDAEADLAAQWARDRQVDLDSGKTKRPDRNNPMNELRAKAKELGIKVDRRDNIKTLAAKVEAHGQNAA